MVEIFINDIHPENINYLFDLIIENCSSGFDSHKVSQYVLQTF